MTEAIKQFRRRGDLATQGVAIFDHRLGNVINEARAKSAGYAPIECRHRRAVMGRIGPRALPAQQTERYASPLCREAAAPRK